MESTGVTHQTVRLGPGRHPRPGKVVCVMELASMLAGERFTDRPASVCPTIGSILRAYNDNIDAGRRQDLYRFASEAVRTRGDRGLQRRRAEAALNWARARYEEAGAFGKLRTAPHANAGPDEIAFYVIGSVLRRRTRWALKTQLTDAGHDAMLRLVDQLIEMGKSRPLRPPLVFGRAHAVRRLVIDSVPQPALVSG